MRRITIPLRVLLPGAVTAFALSLLTGMLLVQLNSAREQELARVADGLRASASELQHDLDRSSRRGDHAELFDCVACTGFNPLSAGTALIGPDGRVIAATRAAWVGKAATDVLPPWLNVSAGAVPTSGHVSRAGDTNRIVAVYPIDLDGTGRDAARGRLHLAQDASHPITGARTAVWNRFRLLAAGTFAAAALLGVLLNALVTRRVADLLGTVERLGTGNLAARPAVAGTDEIGRLATGMSAMAERLAASAGELRASEERLSLFIEHAPAALAMFDREMRYVAYSRWWARDYGTGTELTGRCHYDVVPNVPERWREVHRRALAGEVLSDEKDRYERADGTVQWLRWEVRPWRDASGNVAGIVILSEDITARTRAEDALHASEDRFRTTFEQAAVGMAHVAPDGYFLRANERLADLLGYTPDQLSALRFQDVTHPDDLPRDLAQRARLLSGELATYQTDKRYLCRDGTHRWASLTLSLHRNAAREPQYFIAVMQDISDRKAAEAELQRTTALLQAVADGTPDAIFVKDRAGKYLLFNQAAAGFVGKPIADVLGRDDTELFSPDSARYLMARDRRVMDKCTLEEEEETITAAGVTRTYLARKVPYRDSSGNVIGLIGTSTDITERKRAEKALRDSEQRYRDLVELSPDGISILQEGRFAYLNRAGAALLGLEPADLIGCPLTDWLHPDDAGASRERQIAVTHSNGAVPPREFRLRHADGTWRVVESCAGPCQFDGQPAVQLIARDITDRKRAEAALRESEEQLRTLVENATEAIVLLDVDTHQFTAVNQNAELLYGFDREHLCTVGPIELSPPLQPDGTSSRDAAVARMLSAFGGDLQVFEWVHRNAHGDDFPCEIRLVRFPSTARRLVRGCVTDISERKSAATFAARQAALLEQIARGSPLPEVLTGIVAIVEDELPGTLASVLLLDRDGRHLRLGVGPSLPAAYNSAIDGLEIGPTVGSCGTAAFERRPVRVNDIATDPRWAAFKDLALTHGLRACWSEPIFAAARGTEPPAVLGTFAVYSRTTGLPNARYAEVVTRVELLASIAIESSRVARDLRDSVRQFRTVFESVPVGLFVADSAGRIVMANALCSGQFGYTGEEFLSQSVERLVPAPQRATHTAHREQYTADPTARVMGEGRELHAERKDGTLFPVEIGLVPMRIGGNRLVLAAVSDISKRAEAERRTRESETRKAAILNSALDCIISIDHEGRVIDFNPAAEVTFGFAAADVLGRVFGNLFVPPAYRDSHRRGMAHFLRTGEGPVLNRRIEMPALRADGSEFPAELSITAISIGEQPTFTAHLRDITDRKRAEEELRALNADLERRVRERTGDLSRLVAILDASPDFIAIAADPSAPAIYNNAAMLRLWADRGLPNEHPVLPAFHPPETVRLLKEVGLPAAARDGVWLGETEVLGANGTVLAVSQLIQAHKGPDGRVQYFSTIMRDISKLKQLETELLRGRDSLLRANAELSKVSRLKDEFLASMSHELRTPLNGVLALSESLQEGVYGPVKPEQASALRDIEQSGRHLLTLINDILDLSKIEAGQIALELGPVDVEAACQAAMRLVKEMALKKRHRVTLSIDGTIGTFVADGKRLKQILVNLLSNAVKFTPDGGTVGLDATAGPNHETVSFAISDTGIGIRKEDIGLLFQPFQQIDSRLSREFAGTGLGLALVRRMVELHGGGIEVESEPGAGSRFTVTLPLRVARPDEPGADGPPARVRKVLVVEDAPNDALHLERYLEEMNVEVVKHARASGVTARARLERPDLVLLDLLLPDGDGYQVLAGLKANPETAVIPVVVVSIADERARCLALGAAEVLLKPIDRDTLRRALQTAGNPVERTRAEPNDTRTAPDPNPTAPLVLVAEDNPVNARAIGDYLIASGYRVVVANDGAQAVALAEERRPAIVLMDVQMPQLDGLEATRRIRALAATAGTPVIAVTALAMPGDRQRCLDAGATEYLTKPLALSQLRDLITKLLAGPA